MINLYEFLNTLHNLETDEQLVDYGRKYVLHGTPFIFLNREDEYYEFRKRIANQFKIAFNEVFITGSAKLGFSYFKRKEFDYDSDIDISMREQKMYHEFLEYVAIG